jgi:hypothetical protein
VLIVFNVKNYKILISLISSFSELKTGFPQHMGSRLIFLCFHGMDVRTPQDFSDSLRNDYR